MKTRFSFLPLLMIPLITLFSFTHQYAASIKGVISNAENAGDVWAIMGMDSTKVTPLYGKFQLDYLKPGTYKFVVEGKAPYKDFVKEGVEVKDGEVVDLGSIILKQ
jgi:hypothetical protein